MDRSRLEAKFLGAMVGSALGDAIGELAFCHPDRTTLSAVIGQRPELHYTDDTAMAIGLAASLIQTGTVDRQHLGDTFRRNFQREPWRGYASGPPTIFSMVISTGISYAQAARTLFGGAGSFGNGAAMRIAPLGLFFCGSDDLYGQACASAEVTHAHPLGKDGAAVQAQAVAQALKLYPEEEFQRKKFVQGLVTNAQTHDVKRKMILLGELLDDNVSPAQAAKRIGRSVAVHESMPFAVYSFLCHPKSFEDCVYCAIMHGGDRDTLGAMAGAISGAYLGIESIPAAWRFKLESQNRIEELALELARKRQAEGSRQ